MAEEDTLLLNERTLLEFIVSLEVVVKNGQLAYKASLNHFASSRREHLPYVELEGLLG